MPSDPSQRNGFVEVYSQELTMRVCLDDTFFMDRVMARLLQKPPHLRLQLTSQSNISFFYVAASTVTEREFLTGVLREEESLKHSIEINSKETATLKVCKEDAFKLYDIGQVPLEMVNEDVKREHLMYRYENMRAREARLDAYYQNACQIVKTKNPSLILSFEQQSKQRRVFK